MSSSVGFSPRILSAPVTVLNRTRPEAVKRTWADAFDDALPTGQPEGPNASSEPLSGPFVYDDRRATSLPHEICLRILQMAQLNPLELIRLLKLKHFVLADVALDNTLWRPFSPSTIQLDAPQKASPSTYYDLFSQRMAHHGAHAKRQMREAWQAKPLMHHYERHSVLRFLMGPPLTWDLMAAYICADGRWLQAANAAWQADPHLVTPAVAQQGDMLGYASGELRCDKHIVSLAVASCGSSLQFASAALRANINVVDAAVRQDGHALQYASQALQANINLILSAIKQQPNAIHHAHPDAWNDASILHALMQVPQRDWLQDAPDSIRDRSDILHESIRNYGARLAWASPRLRDDYALVLTAVTLRGASLADASDALKANPAIVLAACDNDPTAIRFASHVLRDDDDFMTAWLPKQPHDLRYASEALRSNVAFVHRIVEMDFGTLRYAHESLWGHPDLVLLTLRHTQRYLQYLSQQARHDTAFWLSAIAIDPTLVRRISVIKWREADFAEQAIAVTGRALGKAPLHLRASKRHVLTAVKTHGLALKDAARSLRADRDVVLAAVTQNGAALQYAAADLRADSAIALAAVHSNGQALKYAARDLQKDQEFVKDAVRRRGLALQFVVPVLRKDVYIARIAAHQNPGALKFTSAAVRKRIKKETIFVLKYISPRP